MPHVVDDRVFETSTTTGTGAYTLAAAVPGSFKRWNAIVDAITGVAIAVGDTCWYAAWDVDPATYAPTGNGYEQGLGTYSAANTLTRTSVRRSSNANAAVSWLTGTRVVAVVLLSTAILQADAVGAFLLKAASAEPPTPPAGTLYVYSREILPGHVVLRQKTQHGEDQTLQVDLAFNSVIKWFGSNAVVGSMGAVGPTTAGTLAAVTPNSGSAKAQLQRVQIQSAATAAAFASLYMPSAGSAPMFRGGVIGEGGFRWVMRFALQTMVTGQRGFFGIADVVSAPGNVDHTTSTTPGKLGVGFNANTGNWQVIKNITGAAPTLVDLGSNFALDTTSLWELVLFCRPYTTTPGDVQYRFRKFTTNSDQPAFEATGALAHGANIPSATTLLHTWCSMTNNAQASTVVWQLGSIAIQRDW